MTKIVGVHFRNAGKVYFFDPKDLPVKMGDSVIVETIRGVEMGKVMTPPKEVQDEQVVQPLKEVMRLATPEDMEREKKNREREDEAYKTCKELIAKHELEMKLVDCEYTFDNNKLLFYFTADGRIDFRELVKDLAAIFRTRIELRQIGVRDETKILGGIGICGRELCCKTYLSDFAPVSIKMAKTQGLSLNPTKISGVCGRLMCCLKNEEDAYEYLNSIMPAEGDIVQTKDSGTGQVVSLSLLRGKAKVVFEKNGIKEAREYAAEDLTVLEHHKKTHAKKNDADKKDDSKDDHKDDKKDSKENDKSRNYGRGKNNTANNRNKNGNPPATRETPHREKDPAINANTSDGEKTHRHRNHHGHAKKPGTTQE